METARSRAAKTEKSRAPTINKKEVRLCEKEPLVLLLKGYYETSIDTLHQTSTQRRSIGSGSIYSRAWYQDYEKCVELVACRACYLKEYSELAFYSSLSYIQNPLISSYYPWFSWGVPHSSNLLMRDELVN